MIPVLYVHIYIRSTTLSGNVRGPFDLHNYAPTLLTFPLKSGIPGIQFNFQPFGGTNKYGTPRDGVVAVIAAAAAVFVDVVLC